MLGSILMAINGSDFINNPWNTTFAPYTDLLGASFYLIPLSFIAAALYMRTHNGLAVSCFIWISGIFLVSGSILAEWPEAGLIFLIFAAAGWVGTGVAIFMNKKFYG